MKLKTLALVLLVLMFSITVALAHSWYDTDCCSDRDCAPAAEEVKFGDDGSTTVVIILNDKKYTVVYPKDFPKDKIRPSHDGKYHACAYVYMYEAPPKPLCLYVPISG